VKTKNKRTESSGKTVGEGNYVNGFIRVLAVFRHISDNLWKLIYTAIPK
jgi:hypothetical protein